MLTRRYREPRGLYSNTEDYGFYVRVSGEDRKLLKTALAIARGQLGGIPSNPLLLQEMMRVYVGHKGVFEEPKQFDQDNNFESDI